MQLVKSPIQQFFAADGSPLNGGYIYIGVANQNPQTNPVAVYWDAAGTQPAAQPIRTSNGYVVRSGTPASIYISQYSCSLMVRNKNGALIFSDLNVILDVENSELPTIAAMTALLKSTLADGDMVFVGHLYQGGYFRWAATSSATANGGTIFEADEGGLGRWIRQTTETPHVRWFGAVGNGDGAGAGDDDTSAINLALAAYADSDVYVRLTDGIYNVSSTITIPSKTGLVGDGSGALYALASGFTNTVPTTHYTSTSLVVSMQGETSGAYTPYENQKCVGVKILNQFVEGRVVDAIAMRNCYNAEVDHCEIANFPLGVGVAAASLLHGCRITNNYIHDFSTDTDFGGGYGAADVNLYGIIVDDDRVNSIMSYDVLVQGNWVENLNHGAVSKAKYGNQADGISTQNGRGHRIIGNTVVNVNEGIDTYCDFQTIMGNVFRDCSGWGIKLIHGASFNRVIGNYVKDAGLGGITVTGGNLVNGNVEYNIIAYNHVDGVDPTGVNAAATATSCIKIDDQGTGSASIHNMYLHNVLDCGTFGRYHIVAQNQPVNIDNTFYGNKFKGTPASASWSVSSTYNDVSTPRRTRVETYIAGAQVIPTATWTKLAFDTKLLDSLSEFDNAVNYRWTCTAPGTYLITGQWRGAGLTAPSIGLYKNGGSIRRVINAGIGDQAVQVSEVVTCMPGDYIELFAYHTSGADRDATVGAQYSKFSVVGQ